MAEPLCKALADQGITTAFPIQALTIADALAGRDVCGKAKTGSGKTLAFGLPLLQRLAESSPAPTAPSSRSRATPRARAALVLLPDARARGPGLRRAARRWPSGVGLRIVAVYGGADIERQVRQLRKGCEVIIATPGRLIDLGDRGELEVEDLDVLVLDEADRMADMGFMPQVEWVLRRVVGAAAPDAAVLRDPRRRRRPARQAAT